MFVARGLSMVAQGAFPPLSEVPEAPGLTPRQFCFMVLATRYARHGVDLDVLYGIGVLKP
ncbi:hypothetical protein GCM10011579_047420 [Streptomyces albiflavescens]|uniref:Uncharacterized protein n=1 Tax=Streptomyces albiflavescens TaxID=1623582 RepID=A0A917Y7I1_9ACTN|nr:hypothetical protein GCM10011579_047420 [Streptomyces albiflavescens]